MKKIFTILIIAGAMTTVAQVPAWQWAKKEGGLGNDWGNKIVVDASGNTYVAGSFQSTQITIGSFNFTNADSLGGYTADLFIIKYDSHGNVVWAKSAGGLNDDGVNGLAVDASGNLYVTGYFSNYVIAFGNISLTHTAGVPDDLFIVKFDASGNAVWAKSAGAVCSGVSIDTSGNCYITGYFSTPDITFGSYTLINSGGSGDIFIVKYDASGNAVWAKSEGWNTYDPGAHISTDVNGNCYVTGLFYSPTITFGSTTLTNAGGSDIFIVKYDANGTVVWAKSAGGSGDDTGSGIAIDANGNSYITGSFLSSTITIGSTTLSNAGIYNCDMFVMKYDTNGNLVWAKSAGGEYSDKASSITVDANGNSYITGWFDSWSLIFGSTVLGAFSVNESDLFIVKYDANGNVLWAHSAGGGANTDTGGSDIAADANTNIYITGYFTADLGYIGNFALENTNPSSHMGDVFIWKLCSNPTVLPTITANGATTFCQGDSVTLTASSSNSYLWGNLSHSSTQSILVTDENYLFVTETDANGCSASSLITEVTINPLPDTSIVINGYIPFCQGDSVILSGSWSANSYLWSTGDTNISITVSSPQILSLLLILMDVQQLHYQ